MIQFNTFHDKKKTLNKLEVEGYFLNMIRAIYEKPIANIILSGEGQSPFPKIRNETKMPAFATSIQHGIGSSS